MRLVHVGNGDKPRFLSLSGVLPPTPPCLANLSFTTSRRGRNRTMSQDPNSSVYNHSFYASFCCNGITIPPIVDLSEFLTWLSPLEPRIRHSVLRSNRVRNVGDWLLQTEEFRSWKCRDGQGESQKAVIFCSGNPGVGKTHIR